ncbi:uncharacterized protein ACA1_269300 [Acanthamoeba castellanii str. Neff]|uniref:Uncharacterized protein n=1 Tax=Acanthamoeba castellanii (strain ATCC 30010 / Neff) TaxID=1257118 RepID=L8H1Z0_ACACF|nr:uncharacterized protein ACA1_269300 [Acanthamoeba castellanii str. Neff]ELR19509.1 hypothetical protein ACA1_269300 [Acanthamoeba castellanii str. Neff]
MSKRFGQVNVGALIGQGVRNYWAAPVVSTLAYLPYEWYRQVVTDRSVLELHYPHLTAPDAPDSWVKKANEYLKMKPAQLVAAYRWLQGVTGDVPEWSSDARPTRAS